MKKRIKIIFNPVSGRGLSENDLAKAIRYFENCDYAVDLSRTNNKGDAAQFAMAIDASLSAVVAIGGDGTINEIINGLQDRNIPIGLIPCGTSNLLAKELGIPLTIEKACHVICKGRIFTMDMGYDQKRYFSIMAGIGIDAEVVNSMDSIRRGNITLATYGGPIARTIIGYSFPKISVEVDRRLIEKEASFVFIGNARGYFGPVRFTYLAEVNDGNFDVCIMKGSGRLYIPKYIIGAITRTLRSFSDVVYVRGKEVMVTSDKVAFYQLDGDPGGRLPARFQLVPGAVRFLTP